jgi:putative tryptophan/tyrosine transport system substrate-binding protein
MQLVHLRRREFIGLISGAGAWPLTARAQQSAVPVVGVLHLQSPDGYQPMLAAFRRGLQESGYVEGRNVAIEYRWAEGRSDRLPAMAADLVHRQVTVIAALTTAAALAAKAATTSIPIVFETGGDAVALGLVTSLSRPGGNITGVTQLIGEAAPKLLEFLHELVPTARVIALLTDPVDPALAQENTRSLQAAAHTLGLELQVLNASTEREIDGIFAKLSELRAGGLVIGPQPFFTSHSEQLGVLVARHAVPAVYKGREFAAAGGLMSYGSDVKDAYRLAGSYTGRILKGDKPTNLPVQQATKVELYINLKTAKALGITVPLPLSGRADEIFE